MRSVDDVRNVLALKAEHRTDREVSHLTGVPVNTIRLWRKRGPPKRVLRVLSGVPTCPVCGDDPHDFALIPARPYAYLLGVYLGDGCVGRSGRSWALRIALDDAYPGIVEECRACVELLRGRPVIARPAGRGQRWMKIESTWKQWPCLFPQHGPGRKHNRKIELVPWQQTIVQAEAGAFLRGLIHSDGWRGTNRVCVKGKRYEYPRYQFSNRSADIRRLFTDACDRLGVSWRPWTRFHISVARAASVALLDEVVGPKS